MGWPDESLNTSKSVSWAASYESKLLTRYSAPALLIANISSLNNPNWLNVPVGRKASPSILPGPSVLRDRFVVEVNRPPWILTVLATTVAVIVELGPPPITGAGGAAPFTAEAIACATC